jgi:hypothetical protein
MTIDGFSDQICDSYAISWIMENMFLLLLPAPYKFAIVGE